MAMAMACGPSLNKLTETLYRWYAITPYSLDNSRITQPLPYLPWLDNFHCIGSTTILPTPSCHGSGDSSKELAQSPHGRSKRENPYNPFVIIVVGVIILGESFGIDNPGPESAIICNEWKGQVHWRRYDPLYRGKHAVDYTKVTERWRSPPIRSKRFSRYGLSWYIHP